MEDPALHPVKQAHADFAGLTDAEKAARLLADAAAAGLHRFAPGWAVKPHGPWFAPELVEAAIAAGHLVPAEAKPDWHVYLTDAGRAALIP